MHRIDGQGATPDHRFTDGNPSTGTPATVVTDDWLNDVQENIVRVILAAGIELVKGEANQLLEAITALFDPEVDLSAYVQKGGDTMSGALTINLAEAGLPLRLTRESPGAIAIRFADSDNTKYFGLNGAGQFVVGSQQSLSDGAILWDQGNAGDRIKALAEDTEPSLDHFLITSDHKKTKIRSVLSSAQIAPAMIIEDRKPAGVGGGSFNSGAWRIRDLTTMVRNVDALAVLANNEVTLPAGTYYFEFDAPAIGCFQHKARLFNVTAGSEAITGTSERSENGDTSTSRSMGAGVLTFAEPTTVRIEHRSSSSGNFGDALGVSEETYARLRIWPLL